MNAKISKESFRQTLVNRDFFLHGSKKRRIDNKMKIAETPTHQCGSKNKTSTFGVYLPKAVCIALGLQTHDSVEWFIENEQLIVRRKQLDLQKTETTQNSSSEKEST